MIDYSYGRKFGALILASVAQEKCDRCRCDIQPGQEEYCWYCIETLCYDCWDEHGHCGHPEADAMNEIAREHHGKDRDLAPGAEEG